MAEIKQTKRAGKILNDTMKCCREYRHEFVMPEHLLFVLIDDYNFNKALEIFYSPEMLAERLEDQLENIETVPEDRQYEPEASEQMGQLIEIACQQVFMEVVSEIRESNMFTYPVLMAADILAYNADLVPIGADQKQHLELARNIAQRFNQRYGEFFNLPDPYIPKMGAKVMSLQEPTKKMSKSDENPNACIFILDDKDTIIRKFKRAVTDSETEVRFAEGKDGINNLMTIYSVVTGNTFEEIEKEFAGKGYGDFKLAVGEAVADHLEPVRTKFDKLMADKAYLKECYTDGAQKAQLITRRVVSKVYHKVGLVDR